MFRSEFRSDIDNLYGLSGAEEFARALERMLQGFGCPQFSYVSISTEKVREQALSDIEPEIIHLTNRPDWGRRYIEADYSKSDPVVRECFRSRRAIKWDEGFLTQSRTDDEARMMEDAFEHRIRAGLTLPIHGPSNELGLLMLSFEKAGKDTLQLIDRHAYELQLLAFNFHDAANAALRVRTDVPPPIPLTDREIEILKWTSDGKTAWEIGKILRISERTVNFHLHNVMGKFGVHNKTHAAAKAVSCGLISRSM